MTVTVYMAAGPTHGDVDAALALPGSLVDDTRCEADVVDVAGDGGRRLKVRVKAYVGLLGH